MAKYKTDVKKPRTEIKTVKVPVRVKTDLRGTIADKIISPTVKGLKKSAAVVKRDIIRPGVERARKSAAKRGRAFKRRVALTTKAVKDWKVQNTTYKEGE